MLCSTSSCAAWMILCLILALPQANAPFSIPDAALLNERTDDVPLGLVLIDENRNDFHYKEGQDMINVTCNTVNGTADNISLSLGDKLLKTASHAQSIKYVGNVSWNDHGKDLTCYASHHSLEFIHHAQDLINVNYPPRVVNMNSEVSAKEIAPGENIVFVVSATSLSELVHEWRVNGHKLDQEYYHPWTSEGPNEGTITIGLMVLQEPVHSVNFELKMSNEFGKNSIQRTYIKNEVSAPVTGLSTTVIITGCALFLLILFLLAASLYIRLLYHRRFAKEGHVRNCPDYSSLLLENTSKIWQVDLNDIEEENDTTINYVEESKKWTACAWDNQYAILRPHKIRSLIMDTKRKEKIQFEDWKLLFSAQAKIFCFFNGFYGRVYINFRKRQILLVCSSSITADCPATSWQCKLLMLATEWLDMNAACKFGEKVREIVNKFHAPVQVLVAGESLGGYLAQVVTHTMKKFHFDEKGSLQKLDESQKTTRPIAFVFNAPPSLRRIQMFDECASSTDIYYTPVFNFITAKLPDQYFFLDGQVGTLIFAKDSELYNQNTWQLFENAGTHNFDRETLNLPGGSRSHLTKFDGRVISSNIFDDQEMEVFKTFPSKVIPASYADGKFTCTDDLNFLLFIPQMKYLFEDKTSKVITVPSTSSFYNESQTSDNHNSLADPTIQNVEIASARTQKRVTQSNTVEIPRKQPTADEAGECHV